MYLKHIEHKQNYMGIIRWCLLNLLSAFCPVRSASWIVPYLKPPNFIPSTIIYRTVLPIFPYWKVILCCHVLPQTAANGIPSPKIIFGKTDSSRSRLDRKKSGTMKTFEIVSHISTLWISSHLQKGASNTSILKNHSVLSCVAQNLSQWNSILQNHIRKDR